MPPFGTRSRAAHRTGILGGTFDPPHVAHLALAAAAKHHLALDRIVFLPAGDPWLKRDRANLTPAPTRLRLVRAAVAGLPWAEVDERELHRPGASYTSVTVEELSGDGGVWWFILGQDALDSMPRWHEPARIVRFARLAVARRPDGAGTLVSKAVSRAVPGIDERIDVVPLPALTLSSTDVRERVRAGRAIELLVPEGVRALIAELGLYRDAPPGAER